jgi:signal transduction histidine kinase/CheY-like chemotaxis protein
VYEDRSGTLWIGTENSGLNKFDRETGQFTRYQNVPNDPYSLSHDSVWAICEDQSGELWIGMFGGGLDRFDRESEQFIHYQHDPNDPFGLNDNNVSVIYEDSLGVLWVGSAGGVDSFDRENERFIHHQHDPDDPYSLSNNAIGAIYEDSSGTLWIGTLDGLDKFNRAEGTFTHYREEDGLPSPAIMGILEDDIPPELGGPNLWLGTWNGLSKFNPRTGVFKNYDVSDGIQGPQFSVSSFCKIRDGAMFFGGRDGLNVFCPEEIEDNPYVPPVVLTDFELFNKPVTIGPDSPLTKSITEIDQIELTYRDSVFSFEFAVLHYSDPQVNQYAYMLEGFDQEWNYTDASRRFATYTNLDGGDYVFRVKGSNSDGIWNEEGVSVRITVVPPFWETWWFRSLVGLLVVGGALTVFRARIKTVESQRQKLEIQVAERTRELQVAKEAAEKARRLAEVANQAKSDFLSNMSHELRTPLNGILGYVQILKREKSQSTRQIDGLNVIHQSGEHLLTLINDVLDLSKIEAGRMELYPTDFYFPSFLEGIAGIVLARAEQKDLDFVYAPQDPLPSSIQADETRLRQVLLNLLGNAVKFTDAGQVTFRVSELKRRQASDSSAHHSARLLLRFEIVDTGVGMTSEQLERIFQPFEQVGDVSRRAEGTGLGLTISQKLVRAMGGELQVKSEPGRGSTFWFEIELPVVEMAAAERVPQAETIIGYKSAEDRALRVLVVDDKAYNRSTIVDLLEPLGFVVAEAEDGQQSVAQAQATQPDLIVMDLVMPVMTGFEATQAIRQIPALKDTVVIAMSASAFEEDKRESIVAGCDAFVSKPVSIDQLFAAIETHLNLEWVHETSHEEEAHKVKSLVPPPPEELNALSDLLERGNIRGIRERAMQIGQMDAKYRSFANRLGQLARDYEEKEIRVLIEQCIGADR